MASGLGINGCVLSYFEGTANLHCYTSCTLTTLYRSKVSFLQRCHMKKNVRGVLTSVRYCIVYLVFQSDNILSVLSVSITVGRSISPL